MGTRDARIDAYIAKSADFAKPILSQLRETVHQACPAVEEAWKWSHPHFMYHGMLCGMAAFKQHCTFGFWKGALVVGSGDDAGAAMGQFGRITRLSDLPSKPVMVRFIKKAMQLNESGTKLQRAARRPRPPLAVPTDLKRGLQRNERAQTTFENFSSSHRREYIEWITEAKSEETRQRRLDSAIKWMAEGKSRNWKYLK